MQLDHAKAIKGLGIVVIVLAALGIIVNIIGMVMMGVLAPYMSVYMSEMEDVGGYYSYTAEAMAAQLALSVGSALFGFGIICCIVTLVAGIMAVRYASTPEKLGTVFGWSVAGAIVGFIGMGWIVAILLIIVAVFANKDKKLFQMGAYPTPGAAPVNPMNATAYAGQPVAVPGTYTTAAQPTPGIAPTTQPTPGVASTVQPTSGVAPVAQTTPIPTQPAVNPNQAITPQEYQILQNSENQTPQP